MKCEITDVYFSDLSYFLENVFGAMKIDDEDVRRINNELGQVRAEMSWDECLDRWVIYRR